VELTGIFARQLQVAGCLCLVMNCGERVVWSPCQTLAPTVIQGAQQPACTAQACCWPAGHLKNCCWVGLGWSTLPCPTPTLTADPGARAAGARHGVEGGLVL